MKSLPRLEAAQGSLLPFSNPEDYVSRLWKYRAGHSILTIRIQHKRDELVYYLVFETTAYFSGPISWNGINIEVSSYADTLDFIQKMHIFTDSEINMQVASHFRLVNIYGEQDQRVQIVANNLYIMSEDVFSPKVSGNDSTLLWD